MRPPTPRSTLLLLLALAQIATPLIPAVRDNSFTRSDRAGEPPIVPAGWTFAIWGAIEVLSLGWALWAALRRPTSRPSRGGPSRTGRPVAGPPFAGPPVAGPPVAGRTVVERLAAPLAVVFSGFTLWLLAVTFVEPNWLPLVIFLGMFGGLLAALRIALAARAEIAGWSRLGRGLLWGLLGLYTGWTSVAVWINLTTALAGSGVPITGPVAVAGQLAVLAGATAGAVAVVRWTDGLLPYAAAVLWAFTGATVGAATSPEPVLALAALAGFVVVAGAVVRLRYGVRPRWSAGTR